MDERYSSSAEIYDIVYADIIDYPATAARLAELIWDHNPNARSVLEAACGTGAVIAEMPEFDVAGYDLSPEMIAAARAKLPNVELRVGDMVDMDWGSRFDAVICMFSSIGYLTNLADIELAYRGFAALLAPGGVLIVEPWFRPEQWLPGHVGSNRSSKDEVTVMRMNSSWLEEDGRISVMDMHHLVGRPGNVEHFVERHRMSLVTPEEHLAAFAAAGLAMDHDPQGLIGRGLYVGGLA